MKWKSSIKEGARVMRVVSHVDVGPASAEAFAVPKGRTVRIADTAGGQPGDFVAFNSHDLSERFSQARTRVEERTCVLTAGENDAICACRGTGELLWENQDVRLYHAFYNDPKPNRWHVRLSFT